jgi:putative mRNA 3-end processing factor
VYCSRGDFFIDPQRPVERAVITHAHADHARPGHEVYFAARPGVDILERRVGDAATTPPIHALAWGEPVRFEDVEVSFHPAGHMLGSAQVRVESDDPDDDVWVVSGDYKRADDPTCEAFQPVECDVFVTEATFGLPIYRWSPPEEVFEDIWQWWQNNRQQGRPSVLFAYSAGKAQRILAGLTEFTDERALIHGAMVEYCDIYRDVGIPLLPTEYVTDMDPETDFAGELIVAPPSAFGSGWMDRFDGARTGFASGWMQVRGIRRRRGYDTGFVLSDHIDWPALLQTIDETGARRVLATHGKTGPLVRFLREERDLDAWDLEEAFSPEGPYPDGGDLGWEEEP